MVGLDMIGPTSSADDCIACYGDEEWRPDSDDYDNAASVAVRFSGFEPGLVVGDRGIYWDSGQRHPGDGLGFEAHDTFGRLESEYLADDEKAGLRNIDPNRKFHITPFARGNASMCLRSAQFVSVSLSGDEARAVVEALAAADHDDFYDELVDWWQSGDVRGMDDTFGLSSPRQTWDMVSEALEEACPDAWTAFNLVESLRFDASTVFEDECDYMLTDEWAEERRSSEWEQT